MAEQLHHHRQRVGRVAVVVDNQHAPSHVADRLRQRHGQRLLDGRRRQEGERDREGGAATDALTGDRHLATVQLRQPAHQRQADAESTVGPVDRRFHLREHLEDAFHLAGFQANPGVTDLHLRAVAEHAGAQLDAAVGFGILGRVVEQVGEYLRQPRLVGDERHGLLGQVHHQRVSALFDQRTRGLDGAFHDLAQRCRVLAQGELGLADPGNVEQVIDQAHHQRQLPLHQCQQLAVHRGGHAQHGQRVLQRCQRVAQLVRQRRQELVLAPPHFPEQLLDASALGHLVLQHAVLDLQGRVGTAQRFVQHRKLARLLGLQGQVGGFELGVGGFQFQPLAMQFGQHHDLAAQDLRDHRHHHVVHRAQLVAAQAIHVGDIHRGDENDRGFLETRVLVDHAGGLKPVHPGHVDVQQDQRVVVLHQAAQSFDTGAGIDQFLAQGLQDRAVGQQPAGLVIDQQDLDRRAGGRGFAGDAHRCSHWRRTPSNWSVTTGLAR